MDWVCSDVYFCPVCHLPLAHDWFNLFCSTGRERLGRELVFAFEKSKRIGTKFSETLEVDRSACLHLQRTTVALSSCGVSIIFCCTRQHATGHCWLYHLHSGP